MPHRNPSGVASRANRRTFLAGAAAITATAALAGQFGSATAEERAEISIWLDSFNGGVTSQCMIDNVLTPFSATGTADINATILANSWEAVRTALAGGGGPDVLTTPGPSRALKLARAGQLLALDEFATSEHWSESLVPWALNLGIVDGKLYSIPFEVETLVLYYNKTLFAQQGWTAPATMADLMSLCQVIDDAGIIPFAHCNQEYRSANEWFVGEFLNHVAGPQKVYQALTGSAKFTDQEFVEAITNLTTMQQNGWFMGGLDRYYTTTFADANAAFAEGRAAMKIEGTWWLPNVEIFWGPNAGNENDWDWMPVPSKTGEPIYTLGTATMAINAATSQPETAAHFLTYFFSPDAQATLLTACQFAPGPVTLPAETLTKLDPRHAAILGALDQASSSDSYGYTTSTFWPPKTEAYLIETIEKVWAGDVTVEAYLQGMQSLFDEELAARRCSDDPATLTAQRKIHVNARSISGEEHCIVTTSSGATSSPLALNEVRLRFWQTARFRRRVIPWLFLLPILLVNAAVVAGPAIAAFYYALTDWSGIGRANFIGLANFRRLFFHDPSFWHAFRNNLLWLGIFLTVPIALGLIAATLLAPLKRGAIAYRMTLFLPYVLPSVITASIWRALMNPDRGISGQLASWGVGGFDRAFLGDPKTVLVAIAFIDNWHWWGFPMVLFLAAMQNVPANLYEAARLDGATRWQEFRDITIPGIRPTLVVLLLMTSIWSFLTFDYVWILTQGGPAGASEVLSVLVQSAFLRFEAGYAAAIGVTMSFFVGVVISIFLVLRKRGWEI